MHDYTLHGTIASLRIVDGQRRRILINMETARKDALRPPVIEVVLGIQFEMLPSLTNGHLGWFWGEMHEEFPVSDDVPPLPPDIEGFGDDAAFFGFPAFGLREARGESRLRMSTRDNTWMIQVQNGWLVANWTKKKPDRVYPGFQEVKKSFDHALDRFSKFLNSRNLGSVSPNLWEVTYIDHIPKGTVWQTLDDLPNVFPGLFGQGGCSAGDCEGVNSTWAWKLAPTPGRLRLSVQTAKATTNPPTDILLVRSVARGPLSPNNPQALDECLNFGRNTVVETFMGLASKEARRYWQGENP